MYGINDKEMSSEIIIGLKKNMKKILLYMVKMCYPGQKRVEAAKIPDSSN